MWYTISLLYYIYFYMIVHTPAIVLKRFPYSDTSIIANLFTKEMGKVSVIVKGARRKGSAMAACFQPLNHLDVVFFHKDTREIQTLSKAEFLSTWSRFSLDLQTVSLALALLEITDKTMEKLDPHPELFEDLVTILKAFNDETHPRNVLYWFYQLRVLTVMGFKPDIDNLDLPENSVIAGNDMARHILGLLLHTTLDGLHEIAVDAKGKKAINDYIYSQFKRHVDGMSDLKSIAVLRSLTP